MRLIAFVRCQKERYQDSGTPHLSGKTGGSHKRVLDEKLKSWEKYAHIFGKGVKIQVNFS